MFAEAPVTVPAAPGHAFVSVVLSCHLCWCVLLPAACAMHGVCPCTRLLVVTVQHIRGLQLEEWCGTRPGLCPLRSRGGLEQAGQCAQMNVSALARTAALAAFTAARDVPFSQQALAIGRAGLHAAWSRLPISFAVHLQHAKSCFRSVGTDTRTRWWLHSVVFLSSRHASLPPLQLAERTRTRAGV